MSALPMDSHVHTEWSWDALHGSMLRTCERAVEIGLPAIAFTEHVDHTAWRVPPDSAYEHLRTDATPDGLLVPPAFDAAGYLDCVQQCRERFPELRILSGLELGEPHRHADQVAAVLSCGTFDRVLGSLHALPDGDAFEEPFGLYTHRDPGAVVRSYLTELVDVVGAGDAFTVLAHIDYPVRDWPAESHGPFDASEFEDEFRHALTSAADAGLALELNTRVPLDARILDWWREAGGAAITFASDAHDPADIARGFGAAVQLAESRGFCGGVHPYDVWHC